MGEETLPLLVSGFPFLKDCRLDPAHRLHLGDAGVRHAVHVALQQTHLIGGSEVAVVGDALVVVVSDEVEDILLEVGTRAADGVHLALTDHLGK